MIHDEYRKSLRISKITSMKISLAEKQSMIEESFIEDQTKKNSSMKTIFSIANTMVKMNKNQILNQVGSGIVVIPIIFKEAGIFTCLIVVAIIGVVSYKTCTIQLIHFKPNEIDYELAIKRILGQKGYYAYSISSILLLYLVGMIYFLLSANMIYPFLEYIGAVSGSRSMKFDKFSFQYLGIILIVFNYFLFSLKELSFIIKVSSLGIISIIIFIGYEIVMGIIGMIDLRTHTSHLKLITADLSSVCGVFGLAFFIHNLITTILKNNEHQEHNKRDILIAYIFTGAIYIVLGIFGGFSIAKYESISSAGTVLVYYTPNVFTSIVYILLFLQLLSVIAIIWFVTRQQLFSLIFQGRQPPTWVFHLTNIIFAGCCLIIQMINFSPTMLIALDGAVCGFMLVYVIPVFMHLTCLYKSKSELNQTLLIKSMNINQSSQEQEHLTINDSNKSYTQLKDNDTTNNNINSKKKSVMQSCASSHEQQHKKYSKGFRFFAYGIIILIGFAIAVQTIVFKIKDAIS